jgi:uncharacterized membrane protein
VKPAKNKNKYVVFIAIGFELVSLILLAIWLGEYLQKEKGWPGAQAFLVLLAFLIWFISLMLKLRKIKSD